MSWMECEQAGSRPEEQLANVVEQVIVPRTSDIGGFEVRRALPSRHRRMVGPFVFFDQMGPSRFEPGQGLDVRPHPHIGLATLTYLYAGQLMHRDSLGTIQTIEPGAVNWMTAGKGIVHSERTPQSERTAGSELGGIQAWIALPEAAEETSPAFFHHEKSDLPMIETPGLSIRLLAGELMGQRSAVATFSEMVYADVALESGMRWPVEATHEERALYLVSGQVSIGGQAHAAGQLLILHPGEQVIVQADHPSRLLLIGGEPMDGPRHIWWNFVSSNQERIEQAKADWQAGRFKAVIGDDESMPMPGQ